MTLRTFSHSSSSSSLRPVSEKHSDQQRQVFAVKPLMFTSQLRGSWTSDARTARSSGMHARRVGVSQRSLKVSLSKRHEKRASFASLATSQGRARRGVKEFLSVAEFRLVAYLAHGNTNFSLLKCLSSLLRFAKCFTTLPQVNSLHKGEGFQ